MDRTIEILTCDSEASLPSMVQLSLLPREKLLRVVFLPPVRSQREAVGRLWREQLPGFLICISDNDVDITICKLITDEEIEAHAVFFDQCAQNYRKLATELIYELAAKLKVTIDPANAMHTFGKYKMGRQLGTMGAWKYFFHGIHCGFKHTVTGQSIEVYLVTPGEFGALDPFFFVRYICTTPGYQPLPIALHDYYHDGGRILSKMVASERWDRVRLMETYEEQVLVKERPLMAVRPPVASRSTWKTAWNSATAIFRLRAAVRKR